jgi:hypothetical protein
MLADELLPHHREAKCLEIQCYAEVHRDRIVSAVGIVHSHIVLRVGQPGMDRLV